MTAETREHSVDIRGVTATLVDVVVAGHTVELVLLYDVVEAEAVHGVPFNDGVDEIMQMEVAALGDTFDDGALHAVASAASYILDGRCIRTVKIGHCSEIEPMCPGWTVAKPDWRRSRGQPWGCVPGIPPTSHDDLPPEDEVTRFLRRVSERAMNDLSVDARRPDFDTRAAISLGHGYRGYNLWHSRYPWSQWGMSYRMTLRKHADHDEDDLASPWTATVGFTYLCDGSGRLEAALEGMRIHERQSVRTDEVEEEDGRISQYVAIEVSHENDELGDAFATSLSDVLAKFIEDMTPVVNQHRDHYKARDSTDYEMSVLTGSAERVVGSLVWSRREGIWNYETSDPLIAELLERVLARGFVDMWKSVVTEHSIGDALMHVGPHDSRFLAGLEDELAKSGNPSLEIREVNGG